ncbi:hypothetical protein SRHO_G00078550 [Serrasalmus rhombeus]
MVSLKERYSTSRGIHAVRILLPLPEEGLDKGQADAGVFRLLLKHLDSQEPIVIVRHHSTHPGPAEAFGHLSHGARLDDTHHRHMQRAETFGENDGLCGRDISDDQLDRSSGLAGAVATTDHGHGCSQSERVARAAVYDAIAQADPWQQRGVAVDLFHGKDNSLSPLHRTLLKTNPAMKTVRLFGEAQVKRLWQDIGIEERSDDHIPVLRETHGVQMPCTVQHDWLCDVHDSDCERIVYVREKEEGSPDPLSNKAAADDLVLALEVAGDVLRCQVAQALGLTRTRRLGKINPIGSDADAHCQRQEAGVVKGAGKVYKRVMTPQSCGLRQCHLGLLAALCRRTSSSAQQMVTYGALTWWNANVCVYGTLGAFAEQATETPQLTTLKEKIQDRNMLLLFIIS